MTEQQVIILAREHHYDFWWSKVNNAYILSKNGIDVQYFTQRQLERFDRNTFVDLYLKH